MAEYERVCAYCGKSFIAHNKRGIYCSKKCKDIVSRINRGISCNINTEPYHRICAECGKPFVTYRDEVKTCSHECAQRRHNRSVHSSMTWGEYVKKQHDKKAQSDILKARMKLVRVLAIKAEMMRPKTCLGCAKVFYSQDPKQKYCCKSCRRKQCRKDKRIPKSQIIDTDISIQRLYRRDNGKCYLCGCQCDFNDWRKSSNGKKYPGDKYPTKDHVVPVWAGGLESWENVRLACWRCNVILKHDSLIKVAPLPVSVARREQRVPNKKKTAQYTLEGRLIKVWESTAEIRKELGLNDKHIQNVCRHVRSKTGNAYGFHWEYV